jgi:hypothetical protein
VQPCKSNIFYTTSNITERYYWTTVVCKRCHGKLTCHKWQKRTHNWQEHKAQWPVYSPMHSANYLHTNALNLHVTPVHKYTLTLLRARLVKSFIVWRKTVYSTNDLVSIGRNPATSSCTVHVTACSTLQTITICTQWQKNPIDVVSGAALRGSSRLWQLSSS